jgi:DNA-binding transcriptional LysR family regulator
VETAVPSGIGGGPQALFTSCAVDRRPNGARDAVVQVILFGAGLRRAECVALDLDDYRRPSGTRSSGCEMGVHLGLAVPSQSRRATGTAAEALAALADSGWLVNCRHTPPTTSSVPSPPSPSFEPHITQRADTLQLVPEMTAAGLGIALMPGTYPKPPASPSAPPNPECTPAP